MSVATRNISHNAEKIINEIALGKINALMSDIEYDSQFTDGTYKDNCIEAIEAFNHFCYAIAQLHHL